MNEISAGAILYTEKQNEILYLVIRDNHGNAKCSVYFVAAYQDQTPVAQEGEVEEICLLPFEEALAVLTFDNMKEVLIAADRYLEEKRNG